jgi:dipeptidyl-peptidase-4
MLRPTALALLFAATASSFGCVENLPPEAPPPPPPPLAPVPQQVAADDRAVILPASASAIDFERMARYPEPGLLVPRLPSFSPDGKRVVYLASEAQDKSTEMALFELDLASKSTRVVARAEDLLKDAKATKLSREEELRRERQRQRSKGITQYSWAKRANVMVIPLGGDLFVYDKGQVSRVTETKEPEIDPKLTDDGTKLAYVRGSEVFVMDLATKKETQLTKGAKGSVTHGQSDFNAQEELDEPSGFFWSPAGDKLAFLEVDDAKVGSVAVLGYRNGAADYMDQKYPITGGTNPSVKVAIVDVKSKKTTYLSWPKQEERYVTRFTWSPDGKSLYLQALSRDQKRSALVRADAASGKVSEVFASTSSSWVDLAEMHPLEKSARFLWVGDGEGATKGHDTLQLRDAADGKLVRTLASGAGEVKRVVAVDEAQGRVFFTGSFDGLAQTHLYVVSLEGGAPKRLTPERGTHNISDGSQATGFLDLHSALDRAPKLTIRGLDGAPIGEVAIAPDPAVEALHIRSPELVEIKGPSGDTLVGQLLKPRDLVQGKRYPVLVAVYGGPGVQTMLDTWQPHMLWQHLADRGFVVFQLDNRGSTGRGHAFESALYGKLGEVELEDQLAGVAWLKQQPFVDGSRFAMAGHSYGGFMTLAAMLKAPGTFQVGVAGAPVTDFKLYDSAYTERYLGTPQSNPKGYEGTDMTRVASKLQGKLLVLHSLMDENVHFQNTANLLDAFVAADKTIDFFVFPGERHGYRGKGAYPYALHRTVDFITSNLK